MFSCSCHTKFVFRFVKVVCDWVDRSLWNDAVRAKPKLRFSPTAIVSGCSAIQRFRGRIAFGEVEIFNSGSSNVAQVSWCLADPFWGAKKFVEGSLSVL